MLETRIDKFMSPRTKASAKSTKSTDVIIPERLYFRIGDVATLCKLPAYVLRIKQLLYEQGFTIAGARQQLRDEAKDGKKQAPLPFPVSSSAQLKHIRQGLREILTMLSARA